MMNKPPVIETTLTENGVKLIGRAVYSEQLDQWKCQLKSTHAAGHLDVRYSTDPYAELADMILAFRPDFVKTNA